jgi:O-methyltransferase
MFPFLRYFKNIFSAILNPVGYKLTPYYSDWPEVWSRDNAFISAMSSVENRTLVPRDRCFILYQLARNHAKKEGDFAEVGVYKGGTAYLSASAAPDKHIHLFDTFAGMPEVKEGIDGHKKGDFADTSITDVKTFLGDHAKNVSFHQGFFPNTTKGLENIQFSLVYIDVDIYQSVKDSLEYFYPRLSAGGMMLFDDFDSPKCIGVRKAIDEFLYDKPESVMVTTYYQGLILKV